MELFAQKIAGKIPDAELVQVGSAAQAMRMLYNDQVDSVLIGRVATKREMDNRTIETRLADGITLIYRQKSGLPVSALSEIPVATYLTDEQLGELKDAFAQITKYETIEECLQDGLATPVLIDWRDYQDSFELLIPMFDNGAKDPRFRAPVIYHKGFDENLLQQIKDSLKE
jgi:hypothetical protein